MMRIVIITQDDPFYLAKNIDYLITNLPSNAVISGCIVSDVSPFGKKEPFKDKVLKTLGVRKTEGLYDLKFTRKGFAMCDYVTDPIVANITKFGKDFPTKKMGLNNCSILIDGDFVFNPVKRKGANVFKLDGSFHSEPNPELMKGGGTYKPDPNSKYTSVLFIMRSAAQGLKQVNFFNARTVVWPNNDVAAGYLKKYKDMVRITKSKNRAGITELRKIYEIK